MATLKNHSFFCTKKCINNEDDNIQESEDNTKHRGKLSGFTVFSHLNKTIEGEGVK